MNHASHSRLIDANLRNSSPCYLSLSLPLYISFHLRRPLTLSVFPSDTRRAVLSPHSFHASSSPLCCSDTIKPSELPPSRQLPHNYTLSKDIAPLSAASSSNAFWMSIGHLCENVMSLHGVIYRDSIVGYKTTDILLTTPFCLYVYLLTKVTKLWCLFWCLFSIYSTWIGAGSCGLWRERCL